MIMKKIIWILVAFFFMTPVSAQINSNGEVDDFEERKTDIKEKVSDAWENTKEAVNNATNKVKRKLGYDDDERTRLRVKYMPIYTTDKYNGMDGSEMVETCRVKFYERYPEANIMSAVIPSETWQSAPVYKNGDIVGYLETVYCYVLARDGRDGYLNAEYTFQRYKNVGQAYQRVAAKWPEFTRVDNFTSEVYEQIK